MSGGNGVPGGTRVLLEKLVFTCCVVPPAFERMKLFSNAMPQFAAAPSRPWHEPPGP